MHCVACPNKRNGDDVMCEHLDVILAALFQIKDYDLCRVECERNEIVEFDRGGDRGVGEFMPKLGRVQRLVEDSCMEPLQWERT